MPRSREDIIKHAEDLARHFEPSAQAIRNWVRQADRDAGRRQEGLTTTEQEELRRLRIEEMSPLDAMTKLYELQRLARQ